MCLSFLWFFLLLVLNFILLWSVLVNFFTAITKGSTQNICRGKKFYSALTVWEASVHTRHHGGRVWWTEAAHMLIRRERGLHIPDTNICPIATPAMNHFLQPHPTWLQLQLCQSNQGLIHWLGLRTQLFLLKIFLHCLIHELLWDTSNPNQNIN